MKIFSIGSLLFIVNFVFAQSNQQLSENCEYELNKYSDCLNEMKKIKTDATDISKTINNYCNLFILDACKNVVSNAYSADSNCISNVTDSLDNVTALSIMSLKIAYLTYCATDGNGNICPLSNYLISNANILKQSNLFEPTREMLTSVANDCKISECNERLLILDTIRDKVENIIGKESKLTMDDPVYYNKYVDYYKNKQCNDIGNSVKSNVNAAISLKIISFPF
eukprot:jgi/Orpsp1_1/1175043/evm.model.c7180000052400.1